MIEDFAAWVRGLPPADGRVYLEKIDGAHRLWVDHPRSRNALGPQMMVQLGELVAGLPPGPVIIQGAGGTFCSGGNLDALKEHLGEPRAGRVFGGYMHRVALALRSRREPVVALVEGVALGGGAELAMAAHAVVAVPSARIGFVQARLGVSPGFGGGRWLCERIGPVATARLLAEAALEPVVEGALVQRVSESPVEAAVALAEKLSRDPNRMAPKHWENPSDGELERATDVQGLDATVRAGILRIARAAAGDRETALKVELEVFDGLWGGPVHRAALERVRR